MRAPMRLGTARRLGLRRPRFVDATMPRAEAWAVLREISDLNGWPIRSLTTGAVLYPMPAPAYPVISPDVTGMGRW